MNTIERLGDRLGTVLKAQRKSQGPDVEHVHESDLIERAAAKQDIVRGIAADRDLPLAPETLAPPRPASSRPSARLLQIDVERMHKNNIVTPDSSRTPVAESFRRV